MTNFPKPPSPPAAVPSTPLVTKRERDGALTDYEWSFILDDCLKPKHREEAYIVSFIESFVRCKNISQASSEAGIAYSLGYSLRHRTDIANCIQKIIDKSVIKYGFDASEIMERTKEIVDFDPIEVQRPDGSFKSNLYDIAPEARRNIKKLKVKNIWGKSEDKNGIETPIIIGEVIEYEFYDKLKAIDLSGKEKELFKTTTRVEHTVTKDMANILLEAAKRGQQASVEYAAPKTVEASYTPVDEESE